MIASLTNRIGALFPDEAPDLARLCSGASGTPLGYSHPTLFAELLGINIDPIALEHIRDGYVLLVGYYFLLDAVVDGHTARDSDLLYLPHLLSGALSELITACVLISPHRVQHCLDILRHSIAKNASALRSEKSFYQNPLDPAGSDEFESIIGRSNAVLLLYSYIACVTEHALDDRVSNIIRSLAFYIQMSDDLGDWRADFRAGRYTSLLRTCLARRGRMLTEEEMEADLFLSGAFEERAVVVINGLDTIRKDIQALPVAADTLLAFVVRQT